MSGVEPKDGESGESRQPDAVNIDGGPDQPKGTRSAKQGVDRTCEIASAIRATLSGLLGIRNHHRRYAPCMPRACPVHEWSFGSASKRLSNS